MLDADTALQRVLQQSFDWGTEMVTLTEATGRAYSVSRSLPTATNLLSTA